MNNSSSSNSKSAAAAATTTTVNTTAVLSKTSNLDVLLSKMEKLDKLKLSKHQQEIIKSQIKFHHQKYAAQEKQVNTLNIITNFNIDLENHLFLG